MASVSDVSARPLAPSPAVKPPSAHGRSCLAGKSAGPPACSAIAAAVWARIVSFLALLACLLLWFWLRRHWLGDHPAAFDARFRGMAAGQLCAAVLKVGDRQAAACFTLLRQPSQTEGPGGKGRPRGRARGCLPRGTGEGRAGAEAAR
eukprot:360579-Chlamydomonas_euryale.AAC.4